MDEVLTWEEIERRFDGEWVAIADPEVTEDLEILGGRVVYHGERLDAAEDTVSRLKLRNVAVWFLGPAVPEGVIAIL